jgi:hypothetical protein
MNPCKPRHRRGPAKRGHPAGPDDLRYTYQVPRHLAQHGYTHMRGTHTNTGAHLPATAPTATQHRIDLARQSRIWALLQAPPRPASSRASPTTSRASAHATQNLSSQSVRRAYSAARQQAESVYVTTQGMMQLIDMHGPLYINETKAGSAHNAADAPSHYSTCHARCRGRRLQQQRHRENIMVQND